VDAVERLLVCDVIHQDEPHGTPVVGGRDGPVPLLSGSILKEFLKIVFASEIFNLCLETFAIIYTDCFFEAFEKLLAET
jgi:hypothetical protein